MSASIRLLIEASKKRWIPVREMEFEPNTGPGTGKASFFGYLIPTGSWFEFHATKLGMKFLQADDYVREQIIEDVEFESRAIESADLVFDGDLFDDEIFDDSDERFRYLYPDLGGES